MKKIICFLSLAVVLTAVSYSCRPAAKKEVIVVPSNKPANQSAKEPAKKSTTITLDKNGVKVEAKKVDVVIKN